MHNKNQIIRFLESSAGTVLDFCAGKASDEIAADRALSELGGLLRKLDDAEAVAEILRQQGIGEVGSVIQGDGRREPLYLRDMTNKIAHGSKFNWLAETQSVECVSREPMRWQSATIDLVRLKGVVAAIVGL